MTLKRTLVAMAGVRRRGPESTGHGGGPVSTWRRWRMKRRERVNMRAAHLHRQFRSEQFYRSELDG